MAINYYYRNEPESVRKEQDLHLDRLLKELGVLDLSLWTIDIAHICALMNIRHEMHTITLGVDENYSSEHFYSVDSNFEKEKNRIRNKFNNANQLGIKISKNSISLDTIKSTMSQNNICIVLVDANLLNAKNIDLLDKESLEHTLETEQVFKSQSPTNDDKCCFFNSFYCCHSSNQLVASSSEFDSLNLAEDRQNTSQSGSKNLDELVELNLRNLNSKRSNNNYRGHFIALIGFDDSRQLMFYRNPASKKNFSFTSYLNFEISRKSYGTDQDILFVYV